MIPSPPLLLLGLALGALGAGVAVALSRRGGGGGDSGPRFDTSSVPDYSDEELLDMEKPARRAWGRKVLEEAWDEVFPGEEPTTAVFQILQGQTEAHEGWYGYAGKPANWKGSRNWGAVQCPHGPPCGDDCFGAGDKHADGSDYAACFKRYATDVEGAADFIRNALVYHHGADAKPAALVGDVMGFARALRTPPVYFEGDSTDPEVAALHYAQGIQLAVETGIAPDLGEEVETFVDAG